MPKSVVVIDEHELVRDGVAHHLSQADEFELSGSLGSLEQALEDINCPEADLVVLDLRTAKCDLVEAVNQVHEQLQAEVVLLASQATPTELRAAHEAGVRAFVCKTTPAAQLLEALNAAVSGAFFCSPTLRPLFADSTAENFGLSQRQLEILGCIAKGMSNKEIGHHLGISQPTVSFHMAELRKRLDARTNRRIMPRAAELGLI